MTTAETQTEMKPPTYKYRITDEFYKNIINIQVSTDFYTDTNNSPNVIQSKPNHKLLIRFNDPNDNNKYILEPSLEYMETHILGEKYENNKPITEQQLGFPVLKYSKQI